MTAPAAVLDAPPSIPLGAAPSMPNTPPPLADELTTAPSGPTLGDAVIGGTPAPAAELDVADAPPMTAEQIIGLVSEISAFGLPPQLADAYKNEFRSNQLVNFGVQASGLADALAAYGISAGGGKLPEWLSVTLGVVVLGYGVYSTRSKYVQSEAAFVPGSSEENSGGGYGVAGVSTPLSATNIGFIGAGAGGSGG